MVVYILPLSSDDNILPLEIGYPDHSCQMKILDLAYSPTTKYKIVPSTSSRGNSTILSFGVGVGENNKETRYMTQINWDLQWFQLIHLLIIFSNFDIIYFISRFQPTLHSDTSTK